MGKEERSTRMIPQRRWHTLSLAKTKTNSRATQPGNLDWFRQLLCITVKFWYRSGGCLKSFMISESKGRRNIFDAFNELGRCTGHDMVLIPA